MHIPDGLLDARISVATAAVSAGALGIAIQLVQRRLPRRRVPLIGLTAAFVFAAQMLNFPIAGGTSGHMVGGVLAAVLVGPAAAMVVLTTVLMVQCLVFSDGGLLSLGANVFNMAMIGCVGGYGLYWLLHRVMPGRRGQLVAAAVAGWAATVVAAACCGAELAASGVGSWSINIAAMTNVHVFIGLGEGLATAMVLSAVASTRPELLDLAAPATPGVMSLRKVVVYGLLITAGLAIFVAPFASTAPDGLEKVLKHLGIGGPAAAPLVATPLAEYHIAGLRAAGWVTSITAALGAAVTFTLATLLARLLVPRTAPAPTR